MKETCPQTKENVIKRKFKDFDVEYGIYIIFKFYNQRQTIEYPLFILFVAVKYRILLFQWKCYLHTVILKKVTPQICCMKDLLRSSLHTLTQERIKPKRKLRVSVHLTEQWHYAVDLFALTADFCVSCLIHWFYYISYDDHEGCYVLC